MQFGVCRPLVEPNSLTNSIHIVDRVELHTCVLKSCELGTNYYVNGKQNNSALNFAGFQSIVCRTQIRSIFMFHSHTNLVPNYHDFEPQLCASTKSTM